MHIADIMLLIVVIVSYVLWIIISERWYNGYYDRKRRINEKTIETK